MGRLSRFLGIAISLGLFAIAHARYYYSPTCEPPPTPAPFQHFLVYSTQGIYNPLEGPFPDGCSADDELISTGVCTDSDYVHFKKIMRFTDKEVDAEVARAKEFFLKRFDLDVEDLSKQGRVRFLPIRLDPRQKYTAFVFSGETVPSEGYEVRDGGHLVSFIDPEGVQLGGALEGQKAPQGAIMLFGFYNILITRPKAREEIIRYESLTPMVVSEAGFLTVNCGLKHPVWGEGLAQGLSSNRMLGGGKIQAVTRNVLTFPPLGDP